MFDLGAGNWIPVRCCMSGDAGYLMQTVECGWVSQLLTCGRMLSDIEVQGVDFPERAKGGETYDNKTIHLEITRYRGKHSD